MIFTGDFVATEETSLINFDGLGADLLTGEKIINFESSLHSYTGAKLTKGVALRSPDESVSVLSGMNAVCVTMANNHVTDYEVDVVAQRERFRADGIAVIGFGENSEIAAEPYIAAERKLVVLTFGWDVIRCQYSKRNAEGVNPYIYSYVEEEVRKYRALYPDYYLVVTAHWNYEFERYPQPADREFAHHLIDFGVDAVIGHHPHVVSGCEEYKGKPIFYSLGNFYFPEVEYDGYLLRFHEEARIGLSVKLPVSGGEIEVFLHKQTPSGDKIELLSRGSLANCDYLTERSTFRGLSHSEYLDFFETHKFHKKKLLPTFTSYRHKNKNRLKAEFVKLRQIPVDLRARIKGADSR